MAAVLGEALTGIYSIPGGTAQLFERGVVVTGAAGPVAVEFALPMIGRPHIATDTASAGTATALRPEAVTFRRGGHDINVLGPLVRAALAGRVAVVPTGQASAPQVLTAGPGEIVEPERPTGVGGTVVPAVYGVSLTGPLRERQLYDVALAADPGAGGSWPPTRSTTAGCGTTSGSPTHVTDAHVARRIDRFRPTLSNLGRSGSGGPHVQLERPHPRLVRYANYLHAIGALDVILATGDMYDYQFEYDDDGNGQGNARFLRDLLLGRAPGPDFPDVEELRVPIFMVPATTTTGSTPTTCTLTCTTTSETRTSSTTASATTSPTTCSPATRSRSGPACTAGWSMGSPM